METESPNHCPLQIVDFDDNPDPSNKNRILQLNAEHITRVFKEAGERRVAIIAIAGPSRKGKSFFLDFVLRYLEALEHDESDWMNWENKSQPLDGFKWKTSIDRETTGIVIWSKPFIIKANGQEIAVILMDTQGTYDEFSTEREMSAIVGLSLLSSSCLIFNFFSGIGEDVFNSLDSYIKYGQLALGEKNAEDSMDVDIDNAMKPFQKLLFLIRDWGSPTLCAYGNGSKGGKAYLAEKLKIKPGLTPAGIQVRNTLRHCFAELDCCLLPDLGEKSKEEGFNGSLAQLTPKFCKHLEDLLNDLLNPDDLPLKAVLGNDILAVDMINYFEQYVEVFNGDDIPSPLTLMEATAKISNDTLVNKCFRKYQETMKKKQRGKSFLSDSALLKIHRSVMDEGVREFKSGKKLGGKDLIKPYEEDLVFRIKEAFDYIDAENKRKKEIFIKGTIEECLNFYKEEINAEFEDESTFLEERKFKSLSSSSKSNAVAEMKEKLDQCDEKESEKAETELEEKLNEEEERMLVYNKNRKMSAEKKMTEELKKICSLYKSDLEGRIEEDPYMTEEELVEYHNENKSDFKKRFDKVKKVGGKDFIQHYSKQLDKDLELEFVQKKKCQEIRLHQLEAEGQSLLNETVANLELTFRSELERNDSFQNELEELEKTQVELVEEAEKSFQSKISVPFTSRIGESLHKKLKAEIQSKFQTVVNEVMLAKKECDESYKGALDEAYLIYVQGFDGFVRGDTFHDDDAVEEKHVELQKNAIEVYKALPKLGNHSNPNQFIQILESQIKTYFEEAKVRYMEKKQSALTLAQNCVHVAHQDYQSRMLKNLDLAEDDDHFRDLHNDEKKISIDSFKSKCIIKASSILDKFIEELVTDIDTTFYEELVDVFELKLLDRESGTETAISEAKKLYREEISKHYNNAEFIRPKDLEALHDRMSKLVTEKCLEKTALTGIQRKDLQTALLDTYKIYKEQNDMNVPVDPAIGIDLGTTYSCVAVYLNGSVKVIPNAQGKNTTPSYVSYSSNGSVESVGIPAKDKAYENAENTVFDAKRIIGRKYEDTVLQNDMKFWPFKVVDDEQVPKVEINKRKLFPEQISGEVLRELRFAAEKYLNCTVENAVITVPAYFTDGQRQATIDAGKCAGLNVLNILTEPVAASVAYKLQHNDDHMRHVLTFDLGGGTFDVAVLKMTKGNIETLAVDGDTHLGGEDFDQNIMKYCTLEFQREHGIDLMKDKDSINDKVRQEVRRRLKRLQLECERRKIELASCRSVDIAVDGIYNEGGISVDLKVNLTRDKFEELNEDLFEKTIKIVEHCLKDATITKTKINDIVLVGGSTRIPKVQELLKEFFEGRALNLTINPDEAVAYGAAVQAAMMNGQIAQKDKDFNNIQDVSPMSMGVEVYGGGFSIIIPKNTKIPVKFMEQYRTAHNNQTSVQITVYQGEADVAKNNSWLGEFYLNNIPPADAGRESINVTMEINMQGVLHVTAVCTSTGETDSITVTEHKRRMGKEQIKRILDEARPGGA